MSDKFTHRQRSSGNCILTLCVRHCRLPTSFFPSLRSSLLRWNRCRTSFSVIRCLYSGTMCRSFAKPAKPLLACEDPLDLLSAAAIKTEAMKEFGEGSPSHQIAVLSSRMDPFPYQPVSIHRGGVSSARDSVSPCRRVAILYRHSDGSRVCCSENNPASKV